MGPITKCGSLLAVLAVLVVACQTKVELPRPFTIVLSEAVNTLDPAYVSNYAEQQIVASLFEGLVSFDAQGAVQPAIAESWTISSDGREYRFKLRQATWSDGSPLTADQFVAAWLRLLDPLTKSPQAWLPVRLLEGGKAYNQASPALLHDGAALSSLRNAVAVQALSDHTLWLRTVEPSPWIFQALAKPAFLPLPPHVISKASERWASAKGQICNGPFMIQEWETGRRVLLIRNPAYWQESGLALDRVVMLFTDSPASALQLYQENTADWLPQFKPDNQANLAKRSSFQRSIGQESDYYLYNFHNPVLRDIRIRRAMSLAIDRRQLTSLSGLGLIQESFSVVPGTMVAQSDHQTEVDVTAARQLLAAAGYAGGKGLPELNVLTSDSPNDQAVSASLVAQWSQKLKLKLNVHSLPRRNFLVQRRLGNFDLAQAGWKADFPDAAEYLKLFASDSAFNDSGWSNKAFDQLVAQSASMPDGPARNDRLAEAETLVRGDEAVLPLFIRLRENLIDLRNWGGWQTNPADIHAFKYLYRIK